MNTVDLELTDMDRELSSVMTDTSSAAALMVVSCGLCMGIVSSGVSFLLVVILYAVYGESWLVALLCSCFHPPILSSSVVKAEQRREEPVNGR